MSIRHFIFGKCLSRFVHFSKKYIREMSIGGNTFRTLPWNWDNDHCARDGWEVSCTGQSCPKKHQKTGPCSRLCRFDETLQDGVSERAAKATNCHYHPASHAEPRHPPLCLSLATRVLQSSRYFSGGAWDEPNSNTWYEAEHNTWYWVWGTR